MNTTSLLSPPTDQPELLPGTVSFLKKLEAKGVYTGEQLSRNKPKLYQKIVLLLGQGHGGQFIQDQLGVSKNTVRAVRRREGDTLDLLRDRLAAESFEFAAQADEAASLILSEVMADKFRREDLTIRDVQSLKVASGIAVQNGQLLSGKPTVNIGVDVFLHPSSDLNAELAEHISGLKTAATPTHPTAEKTAQKEGAAGQADTPNLANVIEVQAERVADGQSPDQPT